CDILVEKLLTVEKHLNVKKYLSVEYLDFAELDQEIGRIYNIRYSVIFPP
ncbi:15267_t:CDS:2, partial [Funneliformis caledonium]